MIPELGNDYLVFIKRSTDVSWLTVACITSNDITISNDIIETSSGMDPDWANHVSGKKSFTIQANGIAISDGLEPSQASYEVLFDLSVSGEHFGIRIAKVGTSYAREGKVTITEYSESQSMNEPFSFSATFLGKGKVGKHPIEDYVTYLTDESGRLILINEDDFIAVN